MQLRPNRGLLMTRRKRKTVKTGKMLRAFERRPWKDFDKHRKGKQTRVKAMGEKGRKDQAAATQ